MDFLAWPKQYAIINFFKLFLYIRKHKTKFNNVRQMATKLGQSYYKITSKNDSMLKSYQNKNCKHININNYKNILFITFEYFCCGLLGPLIMYPSLHQLDLASIKSFNIVLRMDLSILEGLLPLSFSSLMRFQCSHWICSKPYKMNSLINFNDDT